MTKAESRLYHRAYHAAHRLEHRKRDQSVKRRFSYAKNLAKHHNREFSLTIEQFAEAIQQNCYYCGKVTFGAETGRGLDRKDNLKGYTIDNILPCCGDCNIHRGATWTVAETKAAIQAVLHLRSLT